jgi:hypothetical protein
MQEMTSSLTGQIKITVNISHNKTGGDVDAGRKMRVHRGGASACKFLTYDRDRGHIIARVCQQFDSPELELELELL